MSGITHLFAEVIKGQVVFVTIDFHSLGHKKRFASIRKYTGEIKNPNRPKGQGIFDKCWDFLSLELGYSVIASGGV